MVEQTKTPSQDEWPRFEHATMAVEILKPDQQINAGGKLSAQVLLDMRNTFEATELSIQLYGCEEIIYISQVS